MSCNITTGRKDYKCKNAIGGIKAIYIAPFSADAGSATFFKFDVHADNNTYEETTTIDVNSGTSIVAQTGSVVLKGISPTDLTNLKDISKMKAHVIVEHRSGMDRLVGKEFGVAIALNSASGGAMSDGSTMTLSFTANEFEIAETPLTYSSSSTQADPN